MNAAQDGNQPEDRRGGPSLGDVRAEVRNRKGAGVTRQAGEELGEPVGVESFGGGEDPLGDALDLGMPARAAKPTRDGRVVVRPDGAAVIGVRVVAGVLTR